MRCIACCLAALLAACAGPALRPPQAPAATGYAAPSQPLRDPLATDAAAPDPQRLRYGVEIDRRWWTVFGSPEIDALVDEALHANPGVDAAAAALRSARESERAQRGAYWPTADLELQSTRQRVAGELASPLAAGPSIFDLHTAQVTVSYAPDLFGANRHQVEAAAAAVELQRDQLAATYLALTANVLAATIAEAGVRAQLDADERIARLQRDQLDSLRLQADAGQVARASVVAQESALAQTLAALPPLRRSRAQLHDQIAALLGTAPDRELPALPDLDAIRLPHEIPVALPSQLVDRRPDVRAALAAVQQAGAAVGVAVSNQLPQLTLSAAGGGSATRIADVLAADSAFWSIAASLAQPLFHGGALAHRRAAAEATYDQAAAQYRATVVGALQNVADALQALQADADALAAAIGAEAAASRALEIGRRQHALGDLSGFALLPIEAQWRQATIARIQAQASRLADTVALYQALGGGWRED